jgi:hypothetical protein
VPLEPRVTMYIDDIKLSPPSKPETWNENFEGLNLGEIGGQSHWLFFAGDGEVDNSQAFTGSQSLRLDNGGTRLLAPGSFLSDSGNMVTSYLRIGAIGSGAGGVMYFNDHQIAESPATLSCHLGHFYVPGYIAFNNEALKQITENTWYKLDVEFDYSANRCRGRVDNESWSNWQNILPGSRQLHVAFIGSVGFAGYPLKAGQLTYDCRYSTMHGMPVTGGRGFRGLKPLWYSSVPP